MDIFQINTLQDARTWVINSGVLDWEWGDNQDYIQVLNSLAFFIFQNKERFQDKESLLTAFIKEELHQNPNDYGL